MTDIEPPIKKTKLCSQNNVNNIITQTIDRYVEKINNSNKNLKAVISEEFEQPLQLIKVFIGHVKDVKYISKTILILNEKVPMKTLQHLKRVRRQDIILCPTDFTSSMSSIQDFIECYVPELRDVFEYFKQVEVPLNPPKIDRHYQETKRFWSCNFHPNKYLEKLTGDDFFQSSELKIHRQYMTIAFEIAKWYVINDNIEFSIDGIFNNINATIVVDPNLKVIVAISFDNRQLHPMQHSAMLAIDNVAKTQNGGAWITNGNHSECPGIPTDILPYLRNKFPTMRFLNNEREKDADNQQKDGPYLCTGYYVYMLREPCLMCSMALVHARAQRVFFCFNNEECGGLKSKTKLQTIASLNHHFEVFTDFL